MEKHWKIFQGVKFLTILLVGVSIGSAVTKFEKLKETISTIDQVRGSTFRWWETETVDIYEKCIDTLELVKLFIIWITVDRALMLLFRIAIADAKESLQNDGLHSWWTKSNRIKVELALLFYKIVYVVLTGIQLPQMILIAWIDFVSIYDIFSETEYLFKSIASRFERKNQDPLSSPVKNKRKMNVSYSYPLTNGEGHIEQDSRRKQR